MAEGASAKMGCAPLSAANPIISLSSQMSLGCDSKPESSPTALAFGSLAGERCNKTQCSAFCFAVCFVTEASASISNRGHVEVEEGWRKYTVVMVM